jgi:tetratricopeptide (TPR) repeat protein
MMISSRPAYASGPFLLALLFLGEGAAQAEPAPSLRASRQLEQLVSDPLVGSAKEQELLQTVRAGKLIRAREQAERILRDQPASIIARYAVAVVFHDEEGNLPRALYHLRLAEKALAARFGATPREAEAQVWHRRLLEEEEEVLGEMDRRVEQLNLMDHYDALYRPKLDRRRIWPLMKLHRFDEALRLARQVALSEDIHVRIAGLNGLIAIESERLKPRETFAVGTQGIDSTGYQSCILLENTAEAAFAVFKFEEAERLALKSLQARYRDCPAPAYIHLANLYLLRADFQRAMTAVKSAREHGIERRYRQQFEMGNQAWLSRLLYALGQFQKARDLAEQVVRAPDRVGMTSYSSDLMRVIASVEHHAALRAVTEEARERASARPLSERATIWLGLPGLEELAWVAARRAGRLLASENTLTYLVRPYFKPLPPWNVGALIEAAGSGLVLRALGEARQRETMPQETAPYFDALEGEIAYRSGKLGRALEVARRTLRGLPRDEVLLRGRTAAWAADAAYRLGRPSEAEPLFHAVLDRFPTALRVLGVRLPVQVLAETRPLSRKIAETLLRSRRLAQGSLGFTVVVTAGPKEKEIRICLHGRGGRRYACAEKDVSSGKSDEERVALAIAAFPAKAFAPKVDLTQRDINSLDGSAVRGEADDVLRQVLGQ